MSGVGISLNPMDLVNYNQQNDMFNTSRSDSLRQANIDNMHRTETWNYYKGQQNKLFNERHMRLQNLRKDAEKAGISMNAALGLSGASPMSINMPSGQGGRVSGQYSRKGMFSDAVKMQFNNQQETHAIDTAIKHAEHQRIQTENQILQKKLHDLHYPKAEVYDPRLGMYVPAYDNRQQLYNQYGNDVTLFPNPDINLEMPESLGLYYYGKGKVDPQPWNARDMQLNFDHVD